MLRLFLKSECTQGGCCLLWLCGGDPLHLCLAAGEWGGEQPPGRSPAHHRVRDPHGQVSLCRPGWLREAEANRCYWRESEGRHLHQLWAGMALDTGVQRQGGGRACLGEPGTPLGPAWSCSGLLRLLLSLVGFMLPGPVGRNMHDPKYQW